MRCNNCGWENASENTVCEKCGTPLKSVPSNDLHSTVREDEPFVVHTPTVREDPEPEPVVNVNVNVNPNTSTGRTIPTMGTVNPYAKGYSHTRHCKLIPTVNPGEDPRWVPGEISLKGDYTELNRANLDPDNNTITSKVQAALTNKDGAWYIQDCSAQKSTFVRASEPIKLKSGDAILMGDRIFVFQED